ncbi:phage tail protein [Streptomyces sp. NPDC004069]
MPLITAPVITPPDQSGGTPPRVEVPEIGRITVTWIDPTGTRWPMTDQAHQDWWILGRGVSGLGATAYALTADPRPRGGARLRHFQAQPRTIILPIWVEGPTHQDFISLWRALGTSFTRTLREGPGQLEVARPDGTVRRIAAYYQDGWEGTGPGGGGAIWDQAVVTLWCEDPYWVDAEPVTVHRETGTLNDYLVPYPTVSSSQVLGATTLTNSGDVEVWPAWRVTGPASAVTMTREDTGETFTLTMANTVHGALLAGQQVTISTDPPRVVSDAGENLFPGLNWPGAVLWSLPPGDTPVTFQLGGSGPGSAVDLTYYPRYETA